MSCQSASSSGRTGSESVSNACGKPSVASLLRRDVQREARSHHLDDTVVVTLDLVDLAFGDVGLGHVRASGPSLLLCRRDARPGACYDERGLRVSSRCLDDDPPALAMAVKADGPVKGTIHAQRCEASDRVRRLLGDRGLLPAAGGPTNPALVEGGDRDSGLEQVLSNGRKENVVVSIGRPRPGVHEHRRTYWLGRQPQRTGERDIAVAYGQLDHARVAWHRSIVSPFRGSAVSAGTRARPRTRDT